MTSGEEIGLGDRLLLLRAAQTAAELDRAFRRVERAIATPPEEVARMAAKVRRLAARPESD